MDELVIVASFATGIEAQIFKAQLEAEEIPCIIANEQLIQANPMWTNMLGGVQIKVRRADLARANQILHEAESE